MIPDTYGPMSPQPFAYYDPGSRCLRMSQGTLDLGSATCCVTLPPWGSMRGGELYAHPTPAPPTGENDCSSLLGTPKVGGGGTLGTDRGRSNLEDHLTRLLPTPTARDHKEEALGLDGISRAEDVSLLPRAVYHHLLPTPRATDGPKGGPGQRNGRGVEQEALRLLPTPRAQNGEPRNQTIWERPTDQPQNLENALARDFGPYTTAIQQWETLTRPAPPSTVERNRKPRLNPKFVEWMMGLPDGWVTSTPGVSSSAALKMLGNGVVPQQALLALNLIGVPR